MTSPQHPALASQSELDRATRATRATLAALGPAIAQGGAALLLRHALAFAVTFAGGVVLARALGAALVGVYFAALTLFSIARQLIDFSVTTHVIRSSEAPTLSTLSRCFWLQQGIGLAVLLVTVVAVLGNAHRPLFPEYSDVLGRLLVAAAIGAYFQSWQSIPAARLERTFAFGRVGLIEVSEAMAFNVVAVALVVSGAGAWALVFALAARGLVPAAIAYSLSPFRPTEGPRGRLSPALRQELASLTGAQGVVWAMNLAPTVIIGGFAGPRALAIAQLAYSLLGSLGTIAGLSNRLSLVAVSRVQSDPAAVGTLVSRSLSVLSVAFVPPLLASASLAPIWVPVVYGEEWTPVAAVMFIGAFPMAAAALLGVIHAVVVSRGFGTLILRQSVLHLIVFCAILGLLVTRAGPLSLAIAHLVTIPSALIFVRVHRRTVGAIHATHALATAGAAAALALIVWQLAAAGASVMAIALWLVFLTGAIWLSWSIVRPRAVLAWIAQSKTGHTS